MSLTPEITSILSAVATIGIILFGIIAILFIDNLLSSMDNGHYQITWYVGKDYYNCNNIGSTSSPSLILAYVIALNHRYSNGVMCVEIIRYSNLTRKLLYHWER